MILNRHTWCFQLLAGPTRFAKRERSDRSRDGYCIMEKAGSKKRKRPEKSVIEEAVSEVLEKGQSINRTALALNISRAYLAKIVKKVKTSGDSSYEH
ncbi:unnamed protein product [Acanthoscelides obtectus]|uniref:Uncharacterized protein n=1 Tax=Acanthoscelides obtectus TaxID=200917 RepID=A0A9P0MEA8_ACAOB|nr:unnamed protein product [Acanthoscelides obtectus]CAK1675257.1 hypothetical protein AOBTE_LOCUS30096 [Acanthoscelides obtectus]